VVCDETDDYIPYMAAAMAEYAAKHIPQVTIVSISRPREIWKDEEEREIVFGSPK